MWGGGTGMPMKFPTLQSLLTFCTRLFTQTAGREVGPPGSLIAGRSPQLPVVLLFLALRSGGNDRSCFYPKVHSVISKCHIGEKLHLFFLLLRKGSSCRRVVALQRSFSLRSLCLLKDKPRWRSTPRTDCITHQRGRVACLYSSFWVHSRLTHQFWSAAVFGPAGPRSVFGEIRKARDGDDTAGWPWGGVGGDASLQGGRMKGGGEERCEMPDMKRPC